MEVIVLVAEKELCQAHRQYVSQSFAQQHYSRERPDLPLGVAGCGERASCPFQPGFLACPHAITGSIDVGQENWKNREYLGRCRSAARNGSGQVRFPSLAEPAACYVVQGYYILYPARRFERTR